MNKRAQAATEYLILLAIVIVIALVAVGAMGGIPKLGGTTITRTGQAYWEQADIGITAVYFDAYNNGTAQNVNGTLVLRNNMPWEITVVNLTLSDPSQTLNIPTKNVSIKTGKEKSITFGNVPAPNAVEGETYSFDVSFQYYDRDSNIGPYVFRADDTLIGEYY